MLLQDEEVSGTFPMECPPCLIPLWWKLETSGRPVQWKCQEAWKRPFSHSLPWTKCLSFCLVRAFLGSWKLNSLVGVKVRNPAAARWWTRIPAVTWDAYSGNKLTTKGARTGDLMQWQTDESRVFHPRLSYLLGQGVWEQWLCVLLQLFTTTWIQMVTEEKKLPAFRWTWATWF